jgi:outer membrane lipoprotein-sorting protein
MGWKLRAAAALLMSAAAMNAQAADKKSAFTVEQILTKYAAARGGAEAWHNVQTMAWSGHIESGNPAAVGTGFVMSFKRPDMTRFDINAPGQKASHIYNGAQGWKLREKRSAQPELQDYSTEELSFARDALGLDGPLMDYKAKGVVVTLGGVDTVEGRKAYRLELTLPSGATRRTWIDAQTFLELRYERPATNGTRGTVSVYSRNYRAFDGLQIPLLLETTTGTDNTSNKMQIDKVAINPPLPDSLFEQPRVLKKRAAPAPRSNLPKALQGPRPPPG